MMRAGCDLVQRECTQRASIQPKERKDTQTASRGWTVVGVGTGWAVRGGRSIDSVAQENVRSITTLPPIIITEAIQTPPPTRHKPTHRVRVVATMPSSSSLRLLASRAAAASGLVVARAAGAAAVRPQAALAVVRACAARVHVCVCVCLRAHNEEAGRHVWSDLTPTHRFGWLTTTQRAICSSRPARLSTSSSSSSSSDFPWDREQADAAIEDGAEGHAPAGESSIISHRMTPMDRSTAACRRRSLLTGGD